MALTDKRIGFIGAGAMGSALINGLLKAGLVSSDQIYAADIHRERLLAWQKQMGIHACADNRAAVAAADILVLAVKPQVMEEVLEEIREQISGQQLIISIAAGVTTTLIETFLPGVPVIRAMPNTPCLVGAGATAICLGKHATPAHEQMAAAIFGAVGTAVTVKENLMDAVTGLSGSGPAYVYIMLEALADAGVRVGIQRDIAMTLAAQTMLGAAKMVLETGEHPGRLKDMVTTPGGTTTAGIYALEEGGLRVTLMNAVMAATRRAQEMSAGQK